MVKKVSPFLKRVRYCANEDCKNRRHTGSCKFKEITNIDGECQNYEIGEYQEDRK